MSGDGKQTVFGVPRFIRRSDVAKLKAADLYRRTLVEQIRGDLAAFGVSEEELNAHGITL